MVQLFVQDRDRAASSGTPAEKIRPGNLVHKEGNDVYNATATDGVDGIAMGIQNHPSLMADDVEDYRTAPDGDALQPFQYNPNDDFDIPFYDLREDGQRVRLRLPEDPNDGSPAPQMGANTVVGVIDDYAGRIVEEGYTPDSGTTVYNQSNGNFIPVGEVRGNAPNVPRNEFHSLIHVTTDDF